MDLFLNELSLKTYTDIISAREPFNQLASIIKKNAQAGYGFQEIKVPSSFFSHAFIDEYIFDKWLGDKDVDIDLRMLIKSKLTTTPLIDEMIQAQTEEDKFLFECKHNRCDALGLGAASKKMFDSISISISEDATWNYHTINTDISIIEEEDIESYKEDVNHVAVDTHFIEHEKWIDKKKKKGIQNGKLLWLKKSSIFPNLVFCENVKKQIESFNISQPTFTQILNRLFELEEYASKRGTIFNADALPTKITPESETRLKDFASVLTLTCPDGLNRLFSWHSRFTPGAGRIHFYPIEASNKIIVGSIANQNVVK